jgi:hypothetical protein
MAAKSVATGSTVFWVTHFGTGAVTAPACGEMTVAAPTVLTTITQPRATRIHRAHAIRRFT